MITGRRLEKPTTTTRLHITVESTAWFLEDALADVQAIEADDELADEYVLSLLDESALERVLSATNLVLIRTIAAREPESVRELARFVDRDVKNVSTALSRHSEIGLVHLEDAGRAKKPTGWYDQVEIDIPIGSDTADDSDLATG